MQPFSREWMERAVESVEAFRAAECFSEKLREAADDEKVLLQEAIAEDERKEADDEYERAREE